MSDSFAVEKPKIRFLEGGNGIALVALPLALILCVVFYHKVSVFVAGFDIKIEDVYSYVFNLFAIEFGALLALFGLFACKPTPFLERIKNTHAFTSIMAITKITMLAVTIVIGVTFLFGIIRLQPEGALTLQSALFLGWATLAVAATCFYATTVRLIFSALA